MARAKNKVCRPFRCPFYLITHPIDFFIIAPKKSMLQPPKASPSTWQIYFTDQLPLYRVRHPDQKLNVAQAAKELAQEYKFLSEEQREVRHCLL